MVLWMRASRGLQTFPRRPVIRERRLSADRHQRVGGTRRPASQTRPGRRTGVVLRRWTRPTAAASWPTRGRAARRAMAGGSRVGWDPGPAVESSTGPDDCLVCLPAVVVEGPCERLRDDSVRCRLGSGFRTAEPFHSRRRTLDTWSRGWTSPPSPARRQVGCRSCGTQCGYDAHSHT